MLRGMAMRREVPVAVAAFGISMGRMRPMLGRNRMPMMVGCPCRHRFFSRCKHHPVAQMRMMARNADMVLDMPAMMRGGEAMDRGGALGRRFGFVFAGRRDRDRRAALARCRV